MKHMIAELTALQFQCYKVTDLHFWNLSSILYAGGTVL